MLLQSLGGAACASGLGAGAGAEGASSASGRDAGRGLGIGLAGAQSAVDIRPLSFGERAIGQGRTSWPRHEHDSNECLRKQARSSFIGCQAAVSLQ